MTGSKGIRKTVGVDGRVYYFDANGKRIPAPGSPRRRPKSGRKTPRRPRSGIKTPRRRATPVRKRIIGRVSRGKRIRPLTAKRQRKRRLIRSSQVKTDTQVVKYGDDGIVHQPVRMAECKAVPNDDLVLKVNGMAAGLNSVELMVKDGEQLTRQQLLDRMTKLVRLGGKQVKIAEISFP